MATVHRASKPPSPAAALAAAADAFLAQIVAANTARAWRRASPAVGTMDRTYSELKDGKVNDVERSTSAVPDPDDGVDQALVGVLKVIGTASRILAFQNAMSMACHADRQRLATCLEAMTPGQLVEVAAAARLLSAEAAQALARRARNGCA